ncbi:MAG: hypothetical protein DMF69_01980 [Acidobacteria bacterium]|nr:MAG: hypothetical protein DMF69_01980 [Acidobacteriota bacterium]
MNYPGNEVVDLQVQTDSNAWRTNLFPLLVVLAVSTLVLLPIMISGIPYGGDLLSHFRFAVPFYDSIRAGDWYPGWLAVSNDGLGDPRFRFYPPGLYYLFTAVQFITNDWYRTAISSYIILSVAGGIGAYLWGRQFVTPRTSMWVGIFYSIAPYRVNELYQAALLSEYAACSILPFTFLFVERVCRRRRAIDVCGLGIAYALLVLTHLPTAVIGSLSLAVYALLRIERGFIIATLTRLGVAVALGLAGSAFFWSTMIAELSWIKGNSVQQNIYYDYRYNFLFSPSALTNRNTWYANLMGFVVLGFVLPAVILIFNKKAVQFRPVLILLLASFFMATPLSTPIWAVVPKLSEIQFPWRWLAITSLASALLVAASIEYWKQRLKAVRPRDLAVLLCFVLSVGFIGKEMIYDCAYVPRARMDPLFNEITSAVSFKDWLPVWAKELLQVERMHDKVQAESRVTTVSSWQPERRVFNIENGPAGPVKLRTYYYPHWTATMNGHSLATSPSPDGLLVVNAPSEAGTIEVAFREPPRVAVVAKISAATWMLMLGGCALLTFYDRRLTRSESRTTNDLAQTDQKQDLSY